MWSEYCHRCFDQKAAVLLLNTMNIIVYFYNLLNKTSILCQIILYAKVWSSTIIIAMLQYNDTLFVAINVMCNKWRIENFHYSIIIKSW
jgi:hypothetical protein